MTQQEEQRILDVLGQDFPAVTEAIRNPEKRYQHPTLPLLGVYLTPADLTLELFDRFRETDWVVSCTVNYQLLPPTDGGPPIRWDYATVGIVRAVPVTPPEICYHVTGVEDEESVRTHGIRIGALSGKRSRERFADSRFYVCVTESNWARYWAEVLHTGKPALSFSVRTTGLRFIRDPNCEISGTEVNGFIFVGKVIEPDRLGEPERIDPPKKK